MTDEKLTDEEIVKRLERCVKRGNCNYDTDIVLDLINRQKAEIKRLKGSTIVNNIMEVQRIKRGVKAGAYKEFAEKLQAFCKEIAAQMWNEKAAPISWSYAYAGFIDDIDNLLKEMVGEKE